MAEELPARKAIEIQFAEQTFLCQWHNTTLFVHGPDYNKYDHIFLVENPDVDERGHVFFRRSIQNFEDVLGMFRRNGYTFIENPEVSDFDKDIYDNYYKHQKSVATDATQLVVLQETDLTPRQDKRVAFLAYLLQRNLLQPADFNNEWEAII